ncbi:hypothetical protein RN001_000153 [Aquatica leii]|uniref:SAP30-binding protein n=1 Tax=Aquatica leii TaxID=1421715 RepID=A0AAN7Q6T9_9COLE|nr:hypothetical protein RN001_000153 [Aquatica leii]
MSQSMALASLTASYTDSEGEEENSEHHHENQGSVTLTTPSVSPENKSTPTSRPSTPIPSKITSKVAKLVSYHDDTVVSDDDGEADDSNETETIVNIIDKETTTVVEMDICEDDGIQLPPEAPGHCSTDLQEKIFKFHEKMQNNALDMNAVIQQRKDFRNPSIYEKLIQFCSINELGTNYPPEIYDPLRWGKESFYEELAKVQKSEMEKREKDRKSKVEVMSGTKKQEDDPKKRKSKWDQPGGANGISRRFHHGPKLYNQHLEYRTNSPISF